VVNGGNMSLYYHAKKGLIGTMDLILFFFISTLEAIGIFLIMFALFRRPVIENLMGCIYIGIVLSLESFLTRYSTQMSDFSVIIQMVTMIISIMLIWKVQWFYSGLMTAMSYGMYLSIQLIVYFILNCSGIITTLQELQSESGVGASTIGYILQLITFFISLILSLMLKKFNLGWTFVPYGEKTIKYSKPSVKLLLFLTLVSYIGFGSVVYVGKLDNMILFASLTIILISVLGIFVHVSNKEDEFEDD
jgi:hypothetical protein